MTELFDRARDLLPGGVSSPARAFGHVGGDPIFAAHGEGAYLYDTEGRRYVDYVQGFGAVVLGHADPRVVGALEGAARRGGAFGLSTRDEVDLAQRVVERIPSIERVRFLTSGTEASMTAARIARAATGRTVLLKFEGCYHGHADAFLAKAGSGVATFSVPAAAGVPEAAVLDTVTTPYNDLDSARAVMADRDVAAVFVELVAANMGVVPPAPGFLEGLADATREAGALLVADEVVTGFRFGPGGAQELYGVRPDLTMLGKVLGGGLPVGAVGGRAELMDLLSPVGAVYQAGTYAAHPHAMAAGNAVLDAVDDASCERLEAMAIALAEELEPLAKAADASVVRCGPILSLHFRPAAPRDFAEVSEVDRDAFSAFHRAMRDEGVLLAPSPFEAWFPSLAHGPEELEKTLRAARRALGR